MTKSKFYDHESERQVLGALCFDPEQLYQVSVTAQDFNDSNYREIFTALLRCYADGLTPDIKTVADMAHGRVGTSLILDIFSEAFTSANLRYHEEQVKQAAFAREAQRVVADLQQAVGNDDILTKIEAGLLQLQSKQEYKQVKSIPETLMSMYDDMINARKQEYYGIQTGFRKLNETIVGMCPRHLILLGGYTSHGKSLILSQIIRDICENDARVVVFSVEDSREDKLQTILAGKSEVHRRRLIRGHFQTQGQQVLNSIGRIAEYKLEIYDDVYTCEDIDLKIRKHKLAGGVDVVCIDFVQNLLVPGATEIYGRMSHIAITLQRIAKRHNVAILALSQISGEEKGKISLRGAQELASAADIILWIERPEGAVEKGIREFNLICRKNRPFGKTGVIQMQFNESWTGCEEA